MRSWRRQVVTMASWQGASRSLNIQKGRKTKIQTGKKTLEIQGETIWWNHLQWCVPGSIAMVFVFWKQSFVCALVESFVCTIGDRVGAILSFPRVLAFSLCFSALCEHRPIFDSRLTRHLRWFFSSIVKVCSFWFFRRGLLLSYIHWPKKRINAQKKDCRWAMLLSTNLTEIILNRALAGLGRRRNI